MHTHTMHILDIDNIHNISAYVNNDIISYNVGFGTYLIESQDTTK